MTSDALENVGGQVIDFDNHYYEAEDTFSRHMDPEHRDLAIVPKGPVGKRVWMMGDRKMTFPVPGAVLDNIMPPGFVAGLFSGTTDMDTTDLVGGDVETLLGLISLQVADYFPAWRDRDARVKLMDEQGLRSALMIPTIGVLVHYDLRDRPDAVCANYRAFNRWLDEDWGFAGREDGRIFAVPALTLIDLDWAIEELERVAALGARFIWLPHGPVNGKSIAHPTFDPFWARFQELQLKLVFHIGYEGFTHLYGAHWGEDPNRHAAEFSALQHYLAFGERPIVDGIAALILHNLFGRFPGIELISIENGSVWVGPLLRAMDKAAKIGMRGEWLGGRLNNLPSEIFLHHLYINPFHEDDVAALVEKIGASRVLFGSDYPHPEGLAEPVEGVRSIMKQVSPTDARMILHDNAASLLGLPS